MEKVKIGELKIGEKITFGCINGGPLVWRIAAKNHKGFPENTVTIITDRTIGNITFAPADPLDKNHDRRLYGNNWYGDSYVRRLINSEKFINMFTNDELDAIIGTEIRTKRPDVDGGNLDTRLDYLFLLSASETGLKEDDEEGNLLELFRDKENLQAIDIDGNSDWWWLRTPYASNSYDVRNVLADGALRNNNACNGHKGLRPACNLSSDLLVSVV
jgi:hypothetical protein